MRQLCNIIIFCHLKDVDPRNLCPRNILIQPGENLISFLLTFFVNVLADKDYINLLCDDRFLNIIYISSPSGLIHLTLQKR